MKWCSKISEQASGLQMTEENANDDDDDLLSLATST